MDELSTGWGGGGGVFLKFGDLILMELSKG